MAAARSRAVRFGLQGKGPDGAFHSPSLTIHSDSHSTHHNIHDCRRREFLQPLPPRAKAKYCYECLQWFRDGPDWMRHCNDHLCNLNKGCSAIHFSNTRTLLLSPGLCPFCLRDGRWVPFKNQAHLLRHIDNHLRAIESWPCPCPHPLCTCQFESIEELSDHFEAVHEFEKFEPFKLKPRKPERSHSTEADEPIAKRRRSKRKSSQSTEADEPIAKRRRGKMCLSKPESSDGWRKDQDGLHSLAFSRDFEGPADTSCR